MRPPAWFMLTLALWLAAEVAAFALVVYAAGLAGAILFGLLTTLVGIAMLRRIGLAAALGLRKGLSGGLRDEGGLLSQEAMLDGSLAALGSLLLILPGFVSDLIGLALVAPSIRTFVTERLQSGKFSFTQGRKTSPQTIELSREEWSRHDEPKSGP